METNGNPPPENETGVADVEVVPQLSLRQKWLRGLIMIGTVGAIFSLFILLFIFLKGPIFSFLNWVSSIGIWGNILMATVVALSGLPFVYGYSIFLLTCGFLFGWGFGFLTGSIGGTIGAAAGYWAARGIQQSKKRCCVWILKRVQEQPFLRSVLSAVQVSPIKIIILARLSPITFSILNMILGITPNLPFFKKYIWTSYVGMCFEHVVLTYYGSLLRRLADVFSGTKLDTLQIVAYTIQGVALIVISIIIGFYVRRAMRKSLRISPSMRSSTVEESELDGRSLNELNPQPEPAPKDRHNETEVA